MRRMSESVPDVIATGVRKPEDRTVNFRSNVLETLRWFCSEREPDEIASALRQLFADAPRCNLIRCDVIFLGDDEVPESEPAEENELQYLSATTMPFYSEVADTVSSLVQFCINGSSFEGGAWQVRLQLSVRADSEFVWEAVFGDISTIPNRSSERSTKGAERDTGGFRDVSVPVPLEEGLGFRAMIDELIREVRHPLRFVRSSVGLLLNSDSHGLDCEGSRLLAAVESEAERIDRTLREFARLTEPVRPRKSRVDLLDLMRDVSDSSVFVGGCSADVVGHSRRDQDGSSIVEVDSQLFHGVFEFMLQHLPESVAGCHSVNVRSKIEGNSIIVEFEYVGDRIRPELLRKVMLPYSTKDGGSGLRIVPVHGVVSAHGGKLLVGSSGSRVVIRMIVPACRD
jgi:signal transduction histidine kinase